MPAPGGEWENRGLACAHLEAAGVTKTTLHKQGPLGATTPLSEEYQGPLSSQEVWDSSFSP